MRLMPVALIPALMLGGCGRGERYHTLSGATWNTTYTIKYEGAECLGDSVPKVLRAVELSLSPFNANSRISKINRNESIETDSLIERIMAISREVYARSGGAFDPTVSPLINLWGFGYEGNDSRVPSDSAISAALGAVGFGECFTQGGAIVKKSPATTFNFSAVTKGYGCDLIGEMFRRNGVTNYMVEIGGELALSGVNDRGKPWRVMIEAPVEDSEGGRFGMSTVELTDCGVATSGNYRNYHDTSCGRVGHTISPVTGRPVATATQSATVVAPSCAMADALATASMVMPAEDAISMLGTMEGVGALIVTEDSVYSCGIFLN